MLRPRDTQFNLCNMSIATVEMDVTSTSPARENQQVHCGILGKKESWPMIQRGIREECLIITVVATMAALRVSCNQAPTTTMPPRVQLLMDVNSPFLDGCPSSEKRL